MVTAGGRTLRLRSGEEAEAESEAVARSSAHVYSTLKPDLGTWTGGSIWDSSRALSRYLLTLSPPGGCWHSTRTLELGCGCAVAGLTAAALGSEVVLTDRVLHVAEHNRDSNFTLAERERVTLRELRWGTDVGAARAELPPFDLILGGDILYDAEHHAALAETIAALSRPGTTVLICTPDGSCSDLHHPFCARPPPHWPSSRPFPFHRHGRRLSDARPGL